MGSLTLSVASTLLKAWEPIQVAFSRGDGHERHGSNFPFLAVILLCETFKVAACAPLFRRHGCLLGLPLRTSMLAFGGPAALLAICNNLLGYALRRIDVVTFQVVHQVSDSKTQSRVVVVN